MWKITGKIIIIFKVILLYGFIICFSCTSSDLKEDTLEKAKVPIGFNGYIEKSVTRGSINHFSNLVKENVGFGVYAMYTEGGKRYGIDSIGSEENVSDFISNLMCNFHVVASNNSDFTWSYTPLRFWPGSNKEFVSFLAYAPYNPESKLVNEKGEESAQSVKGSNNFVYIRHTVNSNISEQVDLLINNTNALNQFYFDGRKSEDLTDQGEVKFHFIHALSRLGVSITSSALNDSSLYTNGKSIGDVSITIKEILLLGDSISAKNEYPRGAFYRSGLVCLLPKNKAVWSLEDNDGYQSFKIDDFAGRTIQCRKSNDYYAVDTLNTSSDGYLFIIPQDFSCTNDKYRLYCYVSYAVKVNDINGNTVTRDLDTYVRINNKFEAGRSYLIFIDFKDI